MEVVRRMSGHLLLTAVGHYSYVYLFPRQSDTHPAMSALLFTLLFWQCMWWIAVMCFEFVLDRPLRYGRLPCMESQPSMSTTSPRAAVTSSPIVLLSQTTAAAMRVCFRDYV